MSESKLVLVLSENWTLTPPRDLRALVEMAVVAEEAGFDAVMVSEHIVLGPSAGADGIMGNPRDYAMPGNQDPAMPWPSSLVLLSAIAAATTRLRLAACAVIAPLRHPLAPRARARHARPALRGAPRRAADRELAPRRVRRARRPVRASAARCSTSIWQRGKASGATRPRRSPASTTPTRTSTSSRRHGVRTGRGCGSAASPCIRACCAGSSATPTASIRSGSPPTRIWRCCARASPRPAATSPSSSSSVACGPSSRTTAARLRSSRRSRRFPRSSTRGFTTFCIKPSQFVDELARYPAWCREVVERVGEIAWMSCRRGAGPQRSRSSSSTRIPIPIYARMRRDAPVCFVPAVGLWFVTRWADVEFATSHPDLIDSSVTPSPLDRVMGGPSILVLDGPPQKKLRAMLDPSLRPRVVEATRPSSSRRSSTSSSTRSPTMARPS